MDWNNKRFISRLPTGILNWQYIVPFQQFRDAQTFSQTKEAKVFQLSEYTEIMKIKLN